MGLPWNHRRDGRSAFCFIPEAWNFLIQRSFASLLRDNVIELCKWSETVWWEHKAPSFLRTAKSYKASKGSYQNCLGGLVVGGQFMKCSDMIRYDISRLKPGNNLLINLWWRINLTALICFEAVAVHMCSLYSYKPSWIRRIQPENFICRHWILKQTAKNIQRY